MRVLALHENLDAIAAHLSEKFGRPVFVCAGQVMSGTHFRLPAESEYRYLTPLWRCLSKYDSGPCVRRVDHGVVDGIAKSDFYFDLRLSSSLRLLMPLKEGESQVEFTAWHEGMAEFHIHSGLNIGPSIPCTAEDPVVQEFGLETFIHPFRKAKGKGNQDGLRFVSSEDIQNPAVSLPDWHVSGSIPDRMFDDKTIPETGFTVISPPGQYNGNPAASLTPYTRYAICDRTPGRCVVCRGTSGQHKHFGTIVQGYKDHYVDGLICLDCLPTLTAFLDRDR